MIMIYIGGWAFSVFITIILLLAAIEYTRLFFHMGYRSSLPILIAGVLLFILQRWIWNGKHLDIFVSAIIFLTAVSMNLGSKRQQLVLQLPWQAHCILVGWAAFLLH